MKEDQEESGGALVPSARSALTTKSTGLVRRGLDDIALSVESDAPGLDTKWLKSSGLAFDEQMYEAMKPHLIAASQHFYKAGMSFADLLRGLMDWMRETHQLTIEELRAFKEYLMRFMEDLKSGTIGFEELSTVDGDHKSLRLASDDETYEHAKRFFYRGRYKQDNDDFGNAIVDFDKAIELDPRHARYFFRRGVAKQSTGDLDGAIHDYTKATEIDPELSLVYNNRAAAKWAQGDLEGALADYDKAIDTPRRYTGAYINRGAAKQRTGDLDGAIADYTKAIQGTDVVFNSFVAMAYAFRGLAYLWQARDAEAQQDFTKCLELDDSQEAWIERAAGEARERRAPLSWLIPRYASNYSE